MKKDAGHKLLPAVVSAVALIAVAIAAEVLYGMTKYLPLCLFALMCLFPAAINIVVIVMRLKLPEGSVPPISTDVSLHKENISESVETEIPEGTESTVEGKRQKAKKRKPKAASEKRHRIKRALCSIARFYNKNRFWIAILLALGITVFVQIRFFIVQARLTSLYTMSYPILIGMILIFTAFIALDKWCLHAKTGNEFTDSLLKNLRSVLSFLQLALIFMMIAAALKLFGVYDAQVWMKYLLMVFFYYMSAFLVISFAVSAIKKDLLERPFLNIPAPLAIGTAKELSLLTYFEENTGMTMRSLWSIRMIKKLLPITVVLAAALFWFSTGLVQVDPHQTGVVYRFGQMQEEPLRSGLHLCLPWPFDKIEIYDTENIQRLTVGYISDEDEDNTWTDKHGTEEYRLLLGSGDELVSVNLRIEYKIGDICRYLRNNTSPEDLVESYAYELVVDHTINNDLNTLLTIDREEFAEHFKADLIQGIAPYETGIDIVSVVLESIHPPIEISQIYQKIISAEIEAQQKILEAEAYAATTVAGAKTEKDTQIYTAQVDQFSKIANAEASVAEFMASVSADSAYPSSYRYYKYLNAISEAYGNTRLVIVGDGVDSSNIYFGNFGINSNQSSTTESEDVEE